jgi:nucleotide-binding universal stress UspA family protein
LSPDARSIGFPPGETVVASGRPVLVIPYAETIDNVGRRALIAWDGTREAVRAVHGALPLLDRAEAVTVIYVGAQKAKIEQYRPSLEWISSHLKRHRIPSQPEATLRGALSTSEVLLSRAAEMSADLIVSGAYHHSQLREALIGGEPRSNGSNDRAGTVFALVAQDRCEHGSPSLANRAAGLSAEAA